LFGRFTGSTAQSDFSSACVSVVRLCAFTDRPSSITEGALEISRFSCMLFLSVRGFLDYAGPDSHSRLTRLPCCLPPTRQGVGILIWRFSKLNHPAHRCLGLRFATHLAMCHARLEVRMGSLSPFLWGSCIPYNMPVYPGARRITPIRALERIPPGRDHKDGTPTTRQSGLRPCSRRSARHQTGTSNIKAAIRPPGLACRKRAAASV